MKIPKILVVAGCLFFSGCTVIRLDLAQINTFDGIDQEETRIIAQMRAAQSQKRHVLRIDDLQILSGPEADKFSGYWFVKFPYRFSWMKRNHTYLVVVNKETGDVEFAGDWNQKMRPGLEWIF